MSTPAPDDARREPILEAVGLTKVYTSAIPRRRVTTLSQLDLTVYKGETFGLLGPNGAGKTTTQKLFLGLLRPTAGTARVFGRDPQEPEVRSRIGFLPENPYFYSYLTGREFLTFCADLFAIERGVRDSRIKELLELVNMVPAADIQLRKYSKGMLQRIGIAQALVNDPELVFLDEPTSGLDPLGHQQIGTIISELKARGKTLFFNSHIMTDVQRICDRIAILHQGKLVALTGIPELLATGEGLEDFFVRTIQAAGVEASRV